MREQHLPWQVVVGRRVLGEVEVEHPSRRSGSVIFVLVSLVPDECCASAGVAGHRACEHSPETGQQLDAPHSLHVCRPTPAATIATAQPAARKNATTNAVAPAQFESVVGDLHRSTARRSG